VELGNNKDGFCCVGCVCELGGVYVGCGWGKKLVLHWVGFLTEPGFNSPHKLLVFETFSTALVG
jgi:hypothetical protein